MALVVFCGFPASGKSTFAALLTEHLRVGGRSVTTICDGDVALDSGLSAAAPSATASPPRAEMYATAGAEKKTRAQLRARTQRALGTGGVVLCDSLNYIKGFRYELYCCAREAGVAYCVVWTTSDEAACAARDGARSPGDAYGGELLAALVKRFEAPRAHDRWDSPLHVVDAFASDASARAAAVAHSVREDAPALVPTTATRKRAEPHADVFGFLDRVTRTAETALLAEIRAGKGPGEQVRLQGASRVIVLVRVCRAAELRSMRRAYLNLARMHPPHDVSEEAVLDGYVDYINAQLRGS